MHKNFSLASALMLFAPVSGHVILENPKPFLFAEEGPTNPVTAASFPCKMPPGTTLKIDGAPTEMAVGDDQLLTFQGHAVHGGGSCQLSLTSDITSDFQPNKDSRFFVIHSIEGGCPARNVSGNLEGPNVDKYSFQIPAGVDPGQYVLSWTWVPRGGGQPEYYQNCAPILVNAAKTKRMSEVNRREMSLAKSEDFPDMFMANLGDMTAGCTTGDAQRQQLAVAYPNPGESIDHPEGIGKLFKQSCDGNPRASPSASTRVSSSLVPTSSPLVTQSLTKSSTMPQSKTMDTLQSLSKCVPTSTEVTSNTILTVLPLTKSSYTTPSTSSSCSSATPAPSSVGSTCNNGDLLCVNGNMFSTCTGGNWTSPQPLASGTSCTGGAGVRLNIVNPF
ncbi:endoglucanase [Xylariales sp. AK1849]|nr:endoglucanase [Xylariales sp. AK1849]